MASAARRQPLALKLFSNGFVVLWLLLAAFPFVWTLWGSFKVEGDFFSRLDWMNALTGARTIAETGEPFTLRGYEGAWIDREFWRAAINTGIVTAFVVAISLTFGTLGGYALSRSSYRYAFWILIAALISAQCRISRLCRVTCCRSFNSGSGAICRQPSLCLSPSTSPSRCGCCIRSS
jgi:multiple sugar transport system permease protein